MATRGQQITIAVLSVLTTLSLVLLVVVFIHTQKPTEEEQIRAELDKINRSIEAIKKKDEKKTAIPKPKPVPPRPIPPLEWAQGKIQALTPDEQMTFIKAMLIQINGGKPPIKLQAARNLAFLPAEAIEPLADLGLGHRNEDVRYFTLRAFSWMEDGAVPLEAMAVLVDDVDALVQIGLARTLAARADGLRQEPESGQAMALLLALLDKDDPVVVYATVAALEQLRDERAGLPLAALLSQDGIEPDEQQRVCRALETIFEYSVGAQYQLAPIALKKQGRRVERWIKWGQTRIESMGDASTSESPAPDAKPAG